MNAFRLGLSATLLSLGTAYAFDITRCAELVSQAQTAVLQADMDCSADPGACGSDFSLPCGSPQCSGGGCFRAAVLLGLSATLNMNGHVLIGPSDGDGVSCFEGRCQVAGPGEISGAVLGVSASSDVIIKDVDIHNTNTGISVAGRLIATNVTVNNNALGVEADHGIRATNLTANNNEYIGLLAQLVRGTGVTANNNLQGVATFGSIVVAGLTATGNLDVGVTGRRTRLRDSVVTGNNGGGRGIDLVTSLRPLLINSTCGLSENVATKQPWGVCSGD